MNKPKFILYLLMVIAFIVLPMLLFCGCHELTNRPTLLVFTSISCGPCQAEKPAIEAVQRSGYCSVQTIGDDQPQAFRAYGVNNVPYYMLYVDGKRVWQGNTIMPVYHKACGR